MHRRLVASATALIAGFGLALALQSSAPAADSGQPVFAAARGVVIFEFTPVGTTTTRDDAITNVGDAPLTFKSIAVGGLHGSDFKLAADTCSGHTLAPHASCLLTIAFTPTAVGTRAAAITFTDTTPCANYITLAGSGTDTPAPATARAATCATAPAAPGTTTTVTTTTPAPAPAPTNSVEAAGVIGVPKACVSRRTVTVHLKAPKGTTFSKVTVQVRGRHFKTYKGKQITARLSLAGLPRGNFTMRVHATTSSGRSFTVTHRYTTCVKNYR
jgi:hypothetical protein